MRIAILDGNRLETYQVEVAEGGVSRGNIYRGIVANIQPSLNAAFIDYGAQKDGFLSIQDVVDEAWQRKPKNAGHPRVDEVLERGKPILVQVSKDMDGKKGAALTTNISLAGRFLVLTPFDAKRGVSRKVEDEETRKTLREQADGLNLPEGSGFIIRTNALEQNKTTLSRDFNAVARLWKGIQAGAKKGKEPALLHDDQDIVVRALRDFVDARIEEVLVDTDEAYEKAREYMRVFMPRTKTKLIRYTEREPLFSRFDVEKHIHGIYDRKVGLPGGGSIVIDRTEALTAIDVNSGRSTKAGSQEETAVHTNLEAAAEIARQLRLRDIGGLVVVDFIDMRGAKQRQKVEKEMQEAMKVDKARHTVGRISSNGLVEINRQRIRKELNLQTHRPCPTCDGTGRIASTEMVGLNLLRQIESRAATTHLESVRIELHPELADALQNQRRRQIAALEAEFNLRIEIIASNRLHRPEQVIEWNERPKGDARHDKKHAGEHEREHDAKPVSKRGAAKQAKPAPAPKAAAPYVPEPDPDLDLDFDPELDLEPDTETAAAPAAAESAPGGEKKSRRRRRRRRGKGGSEAHAEGHAEAHTDAHADAAHAAHAAASANTVAPSHPDEPAALTFDWGESDDDHEDVDESGPAGATTEGAAGEPGRPAKRRRRRGGRGRSRRREAGTEAPNGAAGEAPARPAPAAAVVSAPAPQPEAHSTEAAAPASADAEAGKAPRKRSRRRRGGRKPSDPGTGGVSSPAHES
ncbi:MAG: Rne/Rng family ribonuclease [Thermoanaerobaculia bacterium]|nr:Rne/Rng family ribonuclease [Thermoanaerobaculia bacterium]